MITEHETSLSETTWTIVDCLTLYDRPVQHELRCLGLGLTFRKVWSDDEDAVT